MRSYIILLISINFLVLMGCTDNIENPVVDNYSFYKGETYFNGSTNGSNWSGGGVAFVDVEDSSLLIRGLFGNLLNYDEINIKVNRTGSNVTVLDSGMAQRSFIYEDVVSIEDEYINKGQQSDIIIYNWNVNEGYITGAFNFTGYNIKSEILSITGEFKIQAAKMGTIWEIFLDKNGYIKCKFKEMQT